MADLRRLQHFYHLAEEEGYDFFYDGVFFNISPTLPLRIAWNTAPAPYVTYFWPHVASAQQWDLELFEDVRIVTADDTDDFTDDFTAYHRIKRPESQARVFIRPAMIDYGTKLMARTFVGEALESVITQPMILGQDTHYMISCVPIEPTNVLNIHLVILEYPAQNGS